MVGVHTLGHCQGNGNTNNIIVLGICYKWPLQSFQQLQLEGGSV